jgi:hypothetical protein
MSDDDASPAPRPRSRKLLLAIFLAPLTCCLTSLFAVGHTIESAKAEVEAELDALAAEGLGARTEDLDPVNGADELEGVYGAFDRLHDDVQIMLGSQPLILMRALTDPDDLQGQMAFYATDPDGSGPKTAAEAAGQVVAILTQHEARIDAALGMEIDYPLDRSQGFEAELPHLMELRQLVQALVIRATLAIRAGRPADAWADVERAVGLTRSVQSRNLIERLVRHALVGMSTQCLVELLRLGAPPGDARRGRLLASLQALEEREGYTLCMRGELEMALTSLPEEADRFLEKTVPKADRPPIPAFAMGPVYARWRADLVLLYGQLIRASTLPDHQVGPALAAVEASAPSSSMLVQLLFPSVSTSFSKEAQARTQLRLAQLALRLTEGGELPPKAPPTLPRDPWLNDGAPLRYRRDGPKSGRIWSVGPDGTDDGGKAPSEDANQSWDAPGTDMVVELGPWTYTPSDPAGGD